MRYFVTIGSRTLEVELGGGGVRIEEEEVVADLSELDGTEVRSLLLGGRSHRLLATRYGSGQWDLHLSGRHYRADVMDERTRAIRRMTADSQQARGPSALRAPMPGLVVKVEVQVGDEVFPGQGLVTVEAMKMENELKSEHRGRVSAVPVSAGDTVEKDDLLVEFESP